MIDFILLLAVALVCFSLTAAFKEIQKDLRRAKENEGFSEAFLEHQRWVAENTETYRPGTFANFLTCYDRVKDSLSESTGSTAEFVNDPLQTPTRIGSIHVVFSGVGFQFLSLDEYAEFRRWLSDAYWGSGKTKSKLEKGSW